VVLAAPGKLAQGRPEPGRVRRGRRNCRRPSWSRPHGAVVPGPVRGRAAGPGLEQPSGAPPGGI